MLDRSQRIHGYLRECPVLSHVPEQPECTIERYEKRSRTHINIRQEWIFEIDLKGCGMGIPSLDVRFPKHEGKSGDADQHNGSLKKQCRATFHGWWRKRGQPLGHLSNRKRRCRPILSKPVIAAALQTSSAGRHKPGFSSLNRNTSRFPGEAIRSVSHLVLARDELMSRLNHNSNGKERTGRLLPGSLRLGFFGQPLYYHTRWFWQARSPARRPSRHRRDQKTFSAGPRSFNSKELWFPGSVTASGVQPVADSRHGRIACKVSLSCTKINLKESRRLQSNHRARLSNPFTGWRRLSKFNSASSFVFRGGESRRLQSSMRALGPTPSLAGGGSLNLCLFRRRVPGTSGSGRSRRAGSSRARLP